MDINLWLPTEQGIGILFILLHFIVLGVGCCIIWGVMWLIDHIVEIPEDEHYKPSSAMRRRLSRHN